MSIFHGATKERGFVLIEALVAVAIFSFALLGLMGMQALSIKNNADAKFRADAAYFANQIIGKMWVDRTNITSYAYRPAENSCAISTTAPTYTAVSDWLADIAAALPGVSTGSASSYKPQIIVDNTALTSTTVTVTLCWRLPNDTQVHNHVASAAINN